MHLTIERRMQIGFGLVVLLLLSITGISIQLSVRQRLLNARIEHTHQVQAQVHQVLSLATIAQATERGFLLTGDPRFIDTRADEYEDIRPEIASLQRLTVDNPVQQANVIGLRRRITAEMKDVEQVIALRKQARIQAARHIVSSRESLTALEGIEQSGEAMEQEENHLLKQRTGSVEVSQRYMTRLLALLLLLVTPSLAAVYLGVRAAHRKTVTTLESVADAFFSLDANWNFTYLNRQAETLIEKKRVAILGSNLWKVFPGLEETVVGQQYHRAAKEEITVQFETFYAPLNKWFEIAAYPSSEGLSVYFRDITARKTADERFRVLFERSSDAHLLFDDTGIVDCNNAAIQMLGLEDKSAVLSLHPAVLSPEFQPDGRRSAEKCLEMDALARANGYHRFEWMHRKADGTDFPVEVALTPVLLNGKDTMLIVWHDLTERKQMEDALRASETRLRDMVENLPAGAIFVEGERMLLNRAAEELTGYSRNELTTLKAWFQTLYHDHADAVRARYKQDKAAGFPSSPTVPLLRKDGIVRQVQFSAYGYTNGEIWLLHDLTERIEAERENARLATILEASPDFVGTARQDGYIFYQNTALNKMLGVSQEEIASTRPHFSRFIPAWAWKQIQQEVLPILVQQGHWQGESALLRADGTEMPVSMTAVGHKEITSDIHYVSVICRDISERKEAEAYLATANAQLEQQILLVNEQAVEMELQKAELEEANQRLTALAVSDGLTGLYNHRAFQEKLTAEFTRSQRYKTPLSIILLDVDKFKTYNDTFGHPEGDVVLKTVSKVLREVARDTDYVCRYGGEEFVIVLPNTEGEEAFAAAERFRSAIEQQSWALRPVTASFGVSTYQADQQTAQELINQADKALYASKEKGRNRVTHYIDLGVLKELDELEGNTSLPYSDIVREMFKIQQDTLTSASEQMREMLASAYNATILSWSRLLDMKDKETEGHSERVTEMMVRLAHNIGMNEEECMYAQWGALLHDVGKMGVPDNILHKPGPLTAKEWVIMRQHTTVAYKMLSPIAFLRPALDIPYCHHEKWDGTGYPRGLKGEEIPLSARLFAVIDVYDALTNDRPYREAWTQEKTVAHLHSLAGTHFDPRAVNAFLAMLNIVNQTELSQSETQDRFAA